MEFQTDVCIVGAGPAGALLGYLLANQGVSTILIERCGELDKPFRGEHLNADGVHILKKHRLYEKIKERGILPMQRVEYYHDRERIKSIPLDSEEGDVSIHFPHGHLLEVLLEESSKYTHFRILMNTTLTELIQNDEGSYVGVVAKHLGEKVTIHSRCIIGADGRYSTVRKLAYIPTEIIKHGYDVLWAKIPAPRDWEPTIGMALVNHKQLSLFTQTGGYIQIGWNIEEDSFGAIIHEPFEPFVSQLLDAFPDLTQIVRQHIQSWKDFVHLRVQSCHCMTWVKDGLAIIGDAAHTMSPTGAFGVSAALKDADFLSEILINAIQQNDMGLSRLKEFERLRRKEIERQQAEQIEQESTFEEIFQVECLQGRSSDLWKFQC